MSSNIMMPTERIEYGRRVYPNEKGELCFYEGACSAFRRKDHSDMAGRSVTLKQTGELKKGSKQSFEIEGDGWQKVKMVKLKIGDYIIVSSVWNYYGMSDWELAHCHWGGGSLDDMKRTRSGVDLNIYQVTEVKETNDYGAADIVLEHVNSASVRQDDRTIQLNNIPKVTWQSALDPKFAKGVKKVLKLKNQA